MDRRSLFTWLLRGGGMLAAGVVAIPGLILALSPAWRRRTHDSWQSLAGPFEVGKVQEARVDIPRADWAKSLREKTVYVWRRAEEDYVVFSRNCTDLSCPVNYDTGSRCFFCPCHGGIFLQDGTPIAGPPREPLYRYAWRLRDGTLQIDLDSLPPMT